LIEQCAGRMQSETGHEHSPRDLPEFSRGGNGGERRSAARVSVTLLDWKANMPPSEAAPKSVAEALTAEVRN
jgi:hypothetical protein